MSRLIDADALMDYCNNLKGKTIDANDIARFPTAVGWISVKDRMPENRQHVLVSLKESNITLIDWVFHGKWVITGVQGETITHWMPMPEPPEESEAE